jgi:hypothetical protein
MADSFFLTLARETVYGKRSMKRLLLALALCASLPAYAGETRLPIRARLVTHYDLCAEGKTAHCALIAESRRAAFCSEHPGKCHLVQLALNERR